MQLPEKRSEGIKSLTELLISFFFIFKCSWKTENYFYPDVSLIMFNQFTFRECLSLSTDPQDLKPFHVLEILQNGVREKSWKWHS